MLISAPRRNELWAAPPDRVLGDKESAITRASSGRAGLAVARETRALPEGVIPPHGCYGSEGYGALDIRLLQVAKCATEIGEHVAWQKRLLTCAFVKDGDLGGAATNPYSQACGIEW